MLHHPTTSPSRVGLLAGLSAYLCWGVFPIYLKHTLFASAWAVICHRIVWSVPVLALLLLAMGRLHELRTVTTPRNLAWLLLSGVLIAINWLSFIVAVEYGWILDVSLGYFLTPLCLVLLGLIVLGERLRLTQWLAVSLAAAGVVTVITLADHTPWLGLAVMLSFSFYALIRKHIAVPSAAGLLIETAWLFPLGLVGLFIFRSLPAEGVTQAQLALLPGLGVMTSVPLILFGLAATRLKLSTVGLLQYVAPSVQLLIAWKLYDEPITPGKWAAFALIWCGLAVYSIDALAMEKRRRRTA